MDFLNSKKGLALVGVLVCLGMALLAFSGNPANMAMCAACFIRDMAGSMKLQTTETVQYFRPEVVGLVVGSFLIALATREYRSTAGSSPPMTRFVLGVATGTFFLKKGYSLGREHDTNKTAGAVLPVLLVIGLCISVFAGVFAVSQAGPGSKHAPVLIALVTALVIGALAQKVRICFAGSVRNIFLMRDFDLMLPIAGLFVVMVVFNLATGGFKLSFAGQPIAHSQHLWNILGLYAVGFGATLAGGCPLRQMTLAGQGSCDAAVTFVGMLIGAAFAHNFGLAGVAASAATAEKAAVLGGPSVAGQIVLVCCIAVLFVIAIANVRKQKNAA